MINRRTQIRNNLQLRARILQAVRNFFVDQDYLEVETPVRIPAPAPETHIDAPSSGTWFLHTSPELCMKRLLAAGYPRIFQICRCFRQAERGHRHLPEFTLLEWYTAGQDYRHMMAQCQDLIQHVAQAIGTGGKLTYQGRQISLTAPWHRLTVKDAFDRLATQSMETGLATDRFDELMGLEIEPQLGWDRPVFLYDYPASQAALARLKPDNPNYAERFELYIGSLELCNAFSELTDPDLQRKRFEQEQQIRKDAGKTVYPMSEPFLNDLKQMPVATGNALGIDRLVMLFADTNCIDEVVAFTPEEL